MLKIALFAVAAAIAATPSRAHACMNEVERTQRTSVRISKGWVCPGMVSSTLMRSPTGRI